MTSHPDAAVAVLIATANRPELLARALRSVERQTFSPLHIVVVDDSCDDFRGATKQVVKQHPNVKYLRNTRSRKRAAGAWNDGLDHLLRITPDPRQLYVAILDDDDEWEPEHLRTCFDAAQSGQFDMVAAQLWRHEDRAPPRLRIPPERLDAVDFLVGNPNIQGSNLFCRLSVLLEAGLFDEWLPSCTDRDLCIRVADLPGVLYGPTERPTVHHYASETHARLSKPGGWAKNEGLSRFFAKYRGRMSADQQAAFRQRAAQLFGWRETAPQPDALVSPSTPADSPPEDPSGAPPHLVVGTIADASALADLAGLLEDLHGLGGRSELAGLDVVVLENGEGQRPSRKLRDLAERERQRGLRVHLVDRARHVEDAEAGRVLDGGAATGRYLPIAPARTVLQSYLYAFAAHRPGAVVWIVDDDLRLDPLAADAKGHLQRRPQPLLPALRKMQALRDRDEADVVIGRCTGDPPVPFAAAVRTQMVDLVASLTWLARLSPQAALPDRAMENAMLRQGRRDYYYDLSRKETDRLEAPFWATPEDGERVGEAFKRLARRAERILAGEQLFRPLAIDTEADPLALSDSLQRGGNTFVLDIETLRLAPNPSPAIDGRPTRRSDMMWALLQQRHLGRKVVGMRLALHQDRSGGPVAGMDVEKVQDDMRGYALFSALEAVSEVFFVDDEDDLRLQLAPARVDRLVSRVRKFLNERLAAFRLSFHRVRGLASVLRDLVERDGAWWQEEKYADARDHLRTFCDRLDDSYASSVLADIERIADIRDSQIKTFLAELPAELAQHRVRLAEPAALVRGFERERVANAKAVARRLAEPVDALGTLGCGSEGVVLTDGKHVYKVFDYWKSWQLDSTLDHLRSLVGAWRDTRSLYPLLAFHHEGRDAVLVYPFEPSEPYTGGHGPGLVNLLVECRQQGVVCRNIHPDNLRVVDARVRLIDYGSDLRPLDDEREFTTMCHRAWLSFRCHDRPDLKALMRQALTRDDLPELAGFDLFHEAVLRMAGERQACEDIALELVAGQPKRVLDYGCGSGKVAKALADAGAEVLGYDPDGTRHKRWRPLADGQSDLRFTTVRAEAMAGAPFDLVVCQRVLCTIEDDAEMRGILDDLRSAVAKDGRVVVTLCDPHFTFCGPTPEAERELPLGARYEDTFVWHKTVRTSGRQRREMHRPEEALLAEFARVGLREVRRVTVPTVELVNFTPASDHLAFELAPDADTPR